MFLLFYSPASNLLQYEYGEFFRVRFHLLYAISYGISWFGFYKLHESKLQNYRQRLIELRQEADCANKAKSQFLANMSHEIRTPINGILGMDSILIKECKDEHLLEYARDIQSASLTLLSIVNDILDISKIESGKMDILLVQYELFSVINDCYNMIFFKAQNKKLELKLKIDPCIPSELFGDEVRIRQIINNLLSNAVKYTQEGTVTLAMDFQEQVIALTANAISGSKEMYLNAGFHDYLSKPVREEALLGMLRKYLRKELIENGEAVQNPDRRVSDEFQSGAEKIAGTEEKAETAAGTGGLLRYEGILDIETGMTYCMNDEDFYMEMIADYKVGDKTAKLQAYFEAEDWENYQIYVHALKSTSLTIGAITLSKEAKALESACKEGNVAYVKEHHNDMMERYQGLLDSIMIS